MSKKKSHTPLFWLWVDVAGHPCAASPIFLSEAQNRRCKTRVARLRRVCIMTKQCHSALLNGRYRLNMAHACYSVVKKSCFEVFLTGRSWLEKWRKCLRTRAYRHGRNRNTLQVLHVKMPHARTPPDQAPFLDRGMTHGQTVKGRARLGHAPGSVERSNQMTVAGSLTASK